MKIRNFICLAMTVLLSGAVFAQQLTVIKLNNRSADEIITTVKPMLNPGEGISGQGYEIYLNARPNTTQNIQTLIARLDKTPTQLLISVRNSSVATNNGSGVAISGSVGNDHARITIGDKTDNNGININALSNITSTNERSTPQIRATEGQPALIYAGTSVPIKMIERQHQNGQIIERETYDYRPVQSGFYATAWLNGDNVRLELNQKNDSVQSGGAIAVSGISTTAHGQLGEWIAIGGLDTSNTRDSRNIGSGITTSTQERGTVFIKVIKAN